MTICCDLDGCLAQFALNYAKLLVRITGEDKFPEDWQWYPDKLIPVWDWEYHWGYTRADHDKAWAKIVRKGSDFWFDLPTMPQGRDALMCLNEGTRHKAHRLYFMTARQGEDAKLQTERWLYSYGIAYPTVIIIEADKKPTVLSALDTDVFIDDKLDTVRAAVGRAKRVYLHNAPHNQVPEVDEKRSSYVRVRTVQEMLEIEGLWEESETALRKRAMFWRR